MERRFLDKKVRNLCESAGIAERKLGAISARKLRNRLADLEAAANVAELTAGRPHPLGGDRAGQFSLELAGGHRIVFSPANDPVPLTADGAISWSQVTIIQIEFIGDYHD